MNFKTVIATGAIVFSAMVGSSAAMAQSFSYEAGVRIRMTGGVPYHPTYGYDYDYDTAYAYHYGARNLTHIPMPQKILKETIEERRTVRTYDTNGYSR